MRIMLAICICMFLAPANLFAGIFWVSPSGTADWTSARSDTPLPEAACTSWQTSMENAKAGDTVYFLPGIYDPGRAPNHYTPAMNPKNSGNPSDGNIVFKCYSYNGTCEIIDYFGYEGASDSGTAFGAYGVDYITWDGFTSEMGSGDGRTGSYNVIRVATLYSADNCTIKNCDILGYGTSTSNNTPLYLHGTDSSIIENNKLHGSTSDTNACGIMMYSVTNTHFRYNNIYDNTWGIYVKAENSGNRFYNNYVYDNSAGVRLYRNWESTYFYNNVFRNNGDAITETANPDAVNGSGKCGPQYVYNNTIYNSSATHTAFQVHYDTTETGNLFYNNIVYNYLKAGRFYVVKLTDSDYNCFYNTSIWWNETDSYVYTEYTSLAAWCSGVSHDCNSYTADPVLVNPGGTSVSDYKLTDSSQDSVKTGGKGGSYPSYIGAWEWPINPDQKIGCSNPRPPRNLRIVNQ